MALDSTHPLYAETLDDMTLMRDSYGGERRMKAKDKTYLPPTPGMLIDGMGIGEPGYENYQAYKQRARYPEFVSDAVEFLLGMMHNKPPVIEVPDRLKGLLEKATADGETLEGLLRRINEQQLVTGRVGAMLDLPLTPDPTNPMPFIALYNAEAIINWDDSNDNVDYNKLSLVVLDESGFERNSEFNWVLVKRYRVLADATAMEIAGHTGYVFGVYKNTTTFDVTTVQSPTLRGVKLDTVPFVFINTKDNMGRPDNPPLLPLAYAAKAVYQSEGDYRQALFLQGQDTLVVIGGIRAAAGDSDDDTRVGAGAMIQVEMGGDAKYIGVSATGLPELRQALENDYKRAEAKTGQLVNSMGSNAESGNALETRLGAQTATLKQIAKAGAAGLERLLKIAARWMGADETAVKVTPNLEFADVTMTGKDLVDLMTAKNMGAPLSQETIHDNMRSRGITTRDFEEEMGLINDEAPVLGTLSGGGHPNLNAPPDNANTPPSNKK
jgi:hypothetical protein